MPTTSYGFTTPTSSTKLSQFAAVVEDLALKLDGRKLVSIAAGTNLNALTNPNGYIQASNTSATLALNYPVTLAGMLEVDAHPVNTMIWQRYTTYASSTTPLPRVFVRGQYPTAGTWSAWAELASTVSSASLIWNVAAQGLTSRSTLAGNQLVYGDTGRRDIKSTLNVAASAAGLFARREGWTVEIDFQNLTVGSSVNLFTLPVGFRPATVMDFAHFDDLNQIVAAIRVSTAGVVSSRTAYEETNGTIRFNTVQAWPAAAYGTASGTIPA